MQHLHPQKLAACDFLNVAHIFPLFLVFLCPVITSSAAPPRCSCLYCGQWIWWWWHHTRVLGLALPWEGPCPPGQLLQPRVQIWVNLWVLVQHIHAGHFINVFAEKPLRLCSLHLLASASFLVTRPVVQKQDFTAGKDLWNYLLHLLMSQMRQRCLSSNTVATSRMWLFKIEQN